MNNARAAYMDASVATASPSRLLVMLCERLVLDVTRALAAQRDGAPDVAHRQLLHAQDIVSELRSSLRIGDWEGADGLGSLYDFLLSQLVRANVTGDAALTQGCLILVTDLSNTWREAAAQSAQTAAVA